MIVFYLLNVLAPTAPWGNPAANLASTPPDTYNDSEFPTLGGGKT